MLLVRTYIAPSPIHGIGLFAREPIAKGTKIWEMCEGFDRVVTEEEVNKLPEIPKETILHTYIFWHGTCLYLGDNSVFINHSSTPNIADGPDDDDSTALRDIQKDEELTVDYLLYMDGDNLKNRGLFDGDNFILPTASGRTPPWNGLS